MKNSTIIIIFMGVLITSCGTKKDSPTEIKLTSENFVYESEIYESSLKNRRADLLNKLRELKEQMDNNQATPSMEQQYMTYSADLADVDCELDEDCDDKPSNSNIGIGINPGIVKPPLPPCRFALCEGSGLRYIIFRDYIESYNMRVADSKGKTIKTIKSNIKPLKGYSEGFNYMELSLKGIPAKSVITSVAQIKGGNTVTYTTVRQVN